MRLTLPEIRNRAIAFGHDWKDETSERAEAQTFWNEFFNVFGIHRRSVASFERLRRKRNRIIVNIGRSRYTPKHEVTLCHNAPFRDAYRTVFTNSVSA